MTGMHQHENLKTWIIVHDGPMIQNHAIEAAAFAEILLNIQRAYDNIGASKYGKNFKKEDCRLYIREIVQGSAAIPASPSTYGKARNGVDPFSVITETYEKLVGTLSSDPEAFQTVLEQEIENPPNRFGILTSLQFLASSESYIELKTTDKKPIKGVCVPKYQKDYLANLIFEYGGTGEITLQGIIVDIKGDKSKYFNLNTKNNHKIKCYFAPDMEEKVISLYKKWVVVTGNMVRSQKTAHISLIDDLKEHTSEELRAIGRYPLIKPIPFAASYDVADEQWSLCNDELAMHAYGRTYAKTIEVLEEELESHIISYTEYPDEGHAETSLIIKKKLANYADFNKIKKLLNEKYGEE